MTTDNLTSVTMAEDPRRFSRRSGEPRLLRRGPRGRLVGGVCGGIADYLEVEALVVRVCFVIVVVASGIGLAIYPLAWALIPARPPADPQGEEPVWRAWLSGWREALGVLVLLVGAALALRHAGLWLGDSIIFPLVLACSGLALILRRATGEEWVPGDALRGGVGGAEAERRRRRRHWPAVVAGAILVVAAAFVFLRKAGIFVESGRAVAQMGVVVVALTLVVGSALARLARSLGNERAGRIRSQERADVAAHLHDSVLQTLALIQRRAGDPREVARLARSQEHELRRWLFDPSQTREADTLVSALELIAVEIETIHGVRIEVVSVGDRALDERLVAMTGAAREALTNAAKFAGEGQIDLYVEVGEDATEVFVRDHGPGFDPAAIPADRGGVRRSILERMSRHGGRAEIKARPGQGTEIELVMGHA